MDGPRSRNGVPRPDLPIWEGTPRAVPPPLGAPPPIEAKRAARIGVPVGTVIGSAGTTAARTRAAHADASMSAGSAWANQGTRIAATADPARDHAPVAALPARRLPRGFAAGVGAGVAVAAIVATVVVMRSGASSSVAKPTALPDRSHPSSARHNPPPSASTAPTTQSSQSPDQSPTTNTSQSSDQSPAAQALADLSAQPMLHYSGLSPDGHSSWQLTVTSGGEAQGELDLGDGKLGVLEVGGRTYFKAADPASAKLLGDLPSGMTATSVRGKWVTGDSALETLLPSGLASAGNLAASLQSALPAQDVGLPSSAASTTRVDGTSAVAVSTSVGVLYISAAQPYRMLRLVPSAAGSGQASDIETVSQNAANDLFGTLIDQTKTLNSALEFGVVFNYSQPKLYCSDSACTVQVNSVVASAADPSAPPAATVVADATASVTIDGQAAGECEAVAKLPLDRSEGFSCQDSDAAEVAQSLKGNLSFDVSIQFAARADTQADVDALVNGELNEQGAGGVRSPAPDGFVG